MGCAMSEHTASKGWPRVAFGDVVRLVRERSKDPEEDGLERYVGLDHLDPGDLRIRRWGEVSDGTTFTSIFRAGHVLFGKRRAYQRKVAVADFDGVCSGDIYVLEPKNAHLVPELLPFVCQADRFFEHAVGTSAGSLSPRTNWESLASYEFVLPPPEEQRRVAIALTSALHLVNTITDQVLTVSAVLASHTHAFEQEISQRITGTLQDVVTQVESGKSPAGQGRRAASNEFGVLRVSAVGDWSFIEDENKKVPAHAFEQRLEVCPGDFLATRANADPDSVGRTCIVDSCRPGLMISDKTWRLVFRRDSGFDPVAILAWTKSRSFRRHVRNQLGGTDAKNISKAQFLTGPLPKVDPKTFNAFGARVRVLRSAQMDIQSRLAATVALTRNLAIRALPP